MVLYQITFNPEVAREEAQSVLDDLGISIIEGRLPRFERHAIATVDIPTEVEDRIVSALSASQKVVAVEKDAPRRALEE